MQSLMINLHEIMQNFGGYWRYCNHDLSREPLHFLAAAPYFLHPRPTFIRPTNSLSSSQLVNLNLSSQLLIEMFCTLCGNDPCKVLFEGELSVLIDSLSNNLKRKHLYH